MSNTAMMYRPSLRERLWHWAGFRVISDQAPPESAEKMPGWAVSDTMIVLSFGDRLRLLVGGRIRVWSTHHTDVVVSTMVTSVRLSLPAPGDKR
jgi:hypothetical protein